MSQIKKLIINHANITDADSRHQSLMNIFHHYWQRGQKYAEVLDRVTQWIEQEYDSDTASLFKLAVLLGKYNYQVRNGGHNQYFDNGYTSRHSKGDFFSLVQDTKLHRELTLLCEIYRFSTQTDFLLTILSEFLGEAEFVIDNPTYEDWEENADGEEKLVTFTNEVDDQGLDDQYYTIADQVMSDFESFLWQH